MNTAGFPVTAGQHAFAKIPSVEMQRSVFDRSCSLKTTFDSGKLIPIFVDEALPGDTFTLQLNHFARMATPLHPVMDNLYIDFFFFYVPNRLLWDNWEKMNGAQDNPGDSTDFLVPVMQAPAGAGYAEHSLSDYFGIPTKIADLEHSALWHRAYNLIWNEWFRDQNLQDSIPVPKGDGPDDPADYVLKRRGKRHDYFTSCLPWPQKGEAIELPLGQYAPVITNDLNPSMNIGQSTLESFVTNVGDILQLSPTDSAAAGVVWDETGMQTDLSQATAATINSIREAFQLQKMLERDARGGTRYTEILRAHFGVNSPDQRLQRPEYLGGRTATININPVAQTAYSALSPLGSLAGFGTSSSQGSVFSKSFVEHGVIIGLACVRAELHYQQGLERMFSRRTRFDFYWPALAHLGEQAVLKKEVIANATFDDDLVFGYQERWAEYRYKPSRVTGQFRSNAATSLDTWHLSQELLTSVLNSTFIEENPPVDRIVAVPSEPEFLMDCFFRYKCARPMPTFSVPGLIDHF